LLEDSTGVNKPEFESCLEDPAVQARVRKDIDEGNDLYVISTPTVYINGKRLQVFPEFLPGILKNILAETTASATSAEKH
jgi:protein-disulfide isomerase